jgi:hypothetical protein
MGVVVFVVLKYCPTNHQLPRCGCKCRVTCDMYFNKANATAMTFAVLVLSSNGCMYVFASYS